MAALFLSGMVTGPVVEAQTSPQVELNWRNALVLALNAKVTSIQVGTYSLQTVNLNQSSLGTISIANVDGSCSVINGNGNIEIVYDPLVDPDNFMLRLPLKSQTTIDVPIESHRLPCQLNDGWMWHMWKGGIQPRHDTGKDAFNFDVNCGSNTTQLHFMDDLGGGNQWLPAIWSSNFRFNVRVMDGSTEKGFSIKPDVNAANAELIYMVGGSEVLAFRDFTKNPHYTYFKRADLKVAFDYTKVPLQGCTGCTYVPHPGIFWADVDNVNGNASGTELRLEGIQFIGQYRTPSPDNCPDNPAVSNPGYSTNESRMRIRVHYRDGSGALSFKEVMLEPTGADNATPDAANTWLWNLRTLDNSQVAYKRFFEFFVDDDGYMYLQTSSDALWPTGFQNVKLYGIRVHTNVSPAEYCEVRLPIIGEFYVDPMGGDVRFFEDYECADPRWCPSLSIPCLDYCNKLSGKRTVENVIGAAASTLSADWDYDLKTAGTWIEADNPDVFMGAKDNRFQRGEDGKWRLDRSFAYQSAIRQAQPLSVPVFDNAGVFVDANGFTAGAFVMYDWRNPANNSATSWATSTIITKYAPSGEVVEEKDVLDVYASAQLGHRQIVANATATNARYDAIDFESFEEHDVAAQSSPFIQELTDDYAHTGRRSYALDPQSALSDPLVSFVVSPQTVSPGAGSAEKKGVIVKVWVKHGYANPPPVNEAPFKLILGSGMPVSTLSSPGLGTYQPGTLFKVAQTGEWSLYQYIKDDYTMSDDGETVEIRLSSNLPSTSPVWVDDIRVQPLDAQMMCHVYDPNTLRLIAQFDDQHFAALYQYDGEGKLVRTLRETEHGIMTVAETQYHSFNRQRHSFTPASGPASSISLPAVDPSGTAQASSQNNLNLLDLRIGGGGVEYEVLSNLDSVLSAFDQSTATMDLTRLDPSLLSTLAPELDIAEKMSYLEKLRDLDSTRRELSTKAEGELDEARRRKIEETLRDIERQRKELLVEKLGLTEEEVKALYEAFATSTKEDRPEED